DAVAHTAEAFGARVERHGGGAVVAALSGHGNAGDQAAQAARCALAMRAAAPRLAVTVTTGRGILADDAPLSGDVVDRALALLRALDATASGVIEIDDVTAALLDGRFEVARRTGRPYLLRDLGAFEGARTLLGRATPCVGRDRELAALEAAYAETVASSVARAVLVTGPPGVGKSRLRAELVSRLAAGGEPIAPWLARGEPISAATPFAMIADALRRVVGVFEAAPPEEQRARLADVLRQTMNPPDRRRVGALLGALLGLPEPDGPSPELAAARVTEARFADETERAFLDFLAAKCAERPQILVLEDVQWADWPSVHLVEVALRALDYLPLFMVALGRPAVRDAFPQLFAGVRVDELRLGPLTKRASEELARAVLGARARREIVERVVERAGGNALYLEELLRAVAEGRGDALPDTVLAMIESRLERLEPDARHVLRAASVFGPSFWAGGVEALVGRRLDRAAVARRLADLSAIDLVAVRDASRFPGEVEYTFRHALVRDAAYA
ncbi:MAG TPA: AAA family ATPase, partial [Byssovorax sp.]